LVQKKRFHPLPGTVRQHESPGAIVATFADDPNLLWRDQ
jgi:hypothetical protein